MSEQPMTKEEIVWEIRHLQLLEDTYEVRVERAARKSSFDKDIQAGLDAEIAENTAAAASCRQRINALRDLLKTMVDSTPS